MGDLITLRDGSTTTDPRLDALKEQDPRSLAYPIAEVVPTDLVPHNWSCYVTLNQGQQGSCVGHGWSHELAAYPAQIKNVTHEYAVDIYYDAQRGDDWEGGEYPGASPQYSGTSVLAGAKVVQQRGFMDAYRWAFSIDDLLRALSHEGPVVVGTEWLNDMFHPKPSGAVSVTGSSAGRHCYLIHGWRKTAPKGETGGPWLRCRNSWGDGWALGGDFFIKVEDFESHLMSDADMCVPTGRHKITIS